MKKEMDKLKAQVNALSKQNNQLESELKDPNKSRDMTESGLFESSKWQGIIASINSLREGINKEIFELFFKSVRDGERKKQNSLVIFIENWKCLDMERLQPYIKSYFEVRSNLK
jgi:hypothetical protein